jgi:hypothetical protein
MVSDDGLIYRTNVWTGNKCVTYEDRRPVSVEGLHDSEPPVLRPAERSRKDKLKDVVQAPLYAFGRIFDDTKIILRKKPAGSLTRRSEDLRLHSMYADPKVGDEERASEERASKESRDWSADFKRKTESMRSKSVIAVKRNWLKRKPAAFIGGTTSGNPNRSSIIWRFSKGMDRHERAILPEAHTTLEPEQQEIEQKQELYDDVGMEKPRDCQPADTEELVGQQKPLATEVMNASRRSESSKVHEDLETQHGWNSAEDMNDKGKAHNNDNWQGQDGTLEEKVNSSREAVLGKEDMVEHNHEVQIRGKQFQDSSDRMDEDKKAMPTTIPNNSSPTKHKFPAGSDPHDLAPPEGNLDGEYLCEHHQDYKHNLIHRSGSQFLSRSLCGFTGSATESEAHDLICRSFWAQPKAFGYNIKGYDPAYDNPCLHYHRDQEIQEWTSTTEEYIPEHVYALTTAELKQLHGAAIKFDVVRTTYKVPTNTPAAYSPSHSEIWEETLVDDTEPQYNRKDLTKLLGLPKPQHDLDELLQIDMNFHIVADWEPYGFDLDTNYSDFYGVPLFDSSPETWLESPDDEDVELENEVSHSESSEVQSGEVKKGEYLNAWRSWSEMEGENLSAQTLEDDEEDRYSLFETGAYEERLSQEFPTISDNGTGEGSEYKHPTQQNAQDYAEQYSGVEGEKDWSHQEYVTPERHSNDCTSVSVAETEGNEDRFERFLHRVIFPRIRARQRREREERLATLLRKAFTNPVIKITKPRSNTLTSILTSSTISSPIRTYAARPQVPSQSLILHLRGRGLSIHAIAVQISTLSDEFLYDSNSRWFNGLRIPDHPSFDDRMVKRILETCDAGTQWWEGEYDDEGKPLPKGFRVLQRRMRISKAEKLVNKCLENYFYWRFLRTVLHPTLMVG